MQQNDYLFHHGVLGMKWGVRRYQPYKEGQKGIEVGKAKKRAENYSTQQRTRDRKIYGKGAEKRINKRMLNGESIQSARHNEVERKARVDSTKKITKTIAKGALVVSGSAFVYKQFSNHGFSNMEASALSETTINVGRQVINALLR